MNKSFNWEKFNQLPVVGIMRHFPVQHVDNIAKQFCKAGLSTLEITMNSEGAAETIANLVRDYGDQINIGAGTVCTIQDLEQALDAGAQFIVSPFINEEVIRTCVSSHIPVFPGAFTPTEIYKAWSLGATMVKVFPATQVGAAYIKEVLAPLNHISLMPTGGITVDNFTEFFNAGAKAVGIGSHLFPKKIIESEQWEALGNFFSSFMKKIENFQSQQNK
jgi:2-dehydro-3-deoxyphosphogluconate aldolase/(4S)-4-hydroxy-2-oxoglutarate aldolase